MRQHLHSYDAMKHAGMEKMQYIADIHEWQRQINVFIAGCVKSLLYKWLPLADPWLFLRKYQKPLQFPHNWPRLSYFLKGDIPFTLPPWGQNRLPIFAARALRTLCKLSVFLSSLQANWKVLWHLALSGTVAILVLLSHSPNHERPLMLNNVYHVIM